MFLDSSRIGNFITTKSKEEIRVNCGYCNDEGYHLYINLKKQVFNCFRCGAKGRTNVNKNLLGNVLSSALTKEFHLENTQPIKLPEASKQTLTQSAINYLYKRGIKESDVERHKIYSASPTSIYVGRIIIPSMPFHGFCEYFTARSYVKYIVPKYLNPAGSKNKLFISPSHSDSVHPQLWSHETVCLVEGPFDFLKTSRHGPCIALLGKFLSDTAKRNIITYFTNVLILLDSGIKESIAAIRIKDQLQNYVHSVTILDCPVKDPGEMTIKDFENIMLGLPSL